MSQLICQQTPSLRGEVYLPGDKSITHRALLFSALAQGTSEIQFPLLANDILATWRALEKLGIVIHQRENSLVVETRQWQPPSTPLDLQNSGTTIRLLAGMLAGADFPVQLDGSPQLRKRPMQRVAAPLAEMGANIQSRNGFPPLQIFPSSLKGIEYRLPIASAQVKSALLLAGLFAQGPTIIHQPAPARDHSERMLQQMGADIVFTTNKVTLQPGRELSAQQWLVPGDFSAAAFPLVAALLVPNTHVLLKNVGINPTRIGLLTVLRRMGANIGLHSPEMRCGEPVADIEVRSSRLYGTTVAGPEVVTMIDEFPIFMVVALAAQGVTEVRDAGELRVKESDRLATMTEALRKMGAKFNETEDGFVIVGKQDLQGAKLIGHDDHRIVMSLAVAGLIAKGKTVVSEAKCVADSFPGFVELMQALRAKIRKQ